MTGIEFEGFTVYQYIGFGCVTFLYLVFCHRIRQLEEKIS